MLPVSRENPGNELNQPVQHPGKACHNVLDGGRDICKRRAKRRPQHACHSQHTLRHHLNHRPRRLNGCRNHVRHRHNGGAYPADDLAHIGRHRLHNVQNRRCNRSCHEGQHILKDAFYRPLPKGNKLLRYPGDRGTDLHKPVKCAASAFSKQPHNIFSHAGQAFRAECLGDGILYPLQPCQESVKDGHSLVPENALHHISDSFKVVPEDGYDRNDASDHAHNRQRRCQNASEPACNRPHERAQPPGQVSYSGGHCSQHRACSHGVGRHSSQHGQFAHSRRLGRCPNRGYSPSNSAVGDSLHRCAGCDSACYASRSPLRRAVCSGHGSPRCCARQAVPYNPGHRGRDALPAHGRLCAHHFDGVSNCPSRRRVCSPAHQGRRLVLCQCAPYALRVVSRCAGRLPGFALRKQACETRHIGQQPGVGGSGRQQLLRVSSCDCVHGKSAHRCPDAVCPYRRRDRLQYLASPSTGLRIVRYRSGNSDLVCFCRCRACRCAGGRYGIPPGHQVDNSRYASFDGRRVQHPQPSRGDPGNHRRNLWPVVEQVAYDLVHLVHDGRQIVDHLHNRIPNPQHSHPYTVQFITADVLLEHLEGVLHHLDGAFRCGRESLVLLPHAPGIGIRIRYLVHPVLHGFQVVCQAGNSLHGPPAKEVVQRRKLFSFWQRSHCAQKILHGGHGIVLHGLCKLSCRYSQPVQYGGLSRSHRRSRCHLQDHPLDSCGCILAFHPVRCKHRAQHGQRLGCNAANLSQVSDSRHNIGYLFLARCGPVCKVVDLIGQQHHFFLSHAERRAPLRHHLPGLCRVDLKGNRHLGGVGRILYQLIHRHAALRPNGCHAGKLFRVYRDLRGKVLDRVRNLVVRLGKVSVFVP